MRASVPVGLFLLDDDGGMRDLLREGLPEGWAVVAEAGTIAEAVEKMPCMISYKGILVAILDGNLPDGSGNTIAQELKWRRPATVLVSFSGSLQDWGHINLEKPVSLEHMWRRVQEVIALIPQCQ